jgi:hypothetical protein
MPNVFIHNDVTVNASCLLRCMSPVMATKAAMPFAPVNVRFRGQSGIGLN